MKFRAHRSIVVCISGHTFLISTCGDKRLLDYELRNMLHRRAAELVRFSYKLSVFQIAGFVLCHPEAAGV